MPISLLSEAIMDKSSKKPLSVQSINAKQRLAMEEWILECSWADSVEQDDLDQLTDEQLIRKMDKHYSTGASGFVEMLAQEQSA